MTRRRSTNLFDRGLSLYAAVVYLFLFLPIAVVIVFSFNAGRHVTQFEGFSLQWYRLAWTDPFILAALKNSIQIATSSAIIATVLGTAAAIGSRRLSSRAQRVIELMTYLAVIIPAIVLGISLLLSFVMFSDWLNPWLAYLWPGDTPPQLGLGRISVVAGESIFGVAVVMIVLQARMAQIDASLEDASADLYATPVRTLFQVTLPQLSSAIVGGFILSFTFAFDDFIIAFFTRGQAQTLPILLFSSIRRGVNPSINAIATVLVLVTLLALLLALFVMTRRGVGGTAIPLGAVDGAAGEADVDHGAGRRPVPAATGGPRRERDKAAT